jgi:hypothetical protein
MAELNAVVWRHLTTSIGTDGTAAVSSSNEFGTHAVSGGGFANGLTGSNGSSTDTGGNDVSLGTPVVGSFPSYDSGTDTNYWTVIFGGTPGASFRAHIFCMLAPGEEA